ncbi:MAG TPA: DUF1572 family protein [Chitinophagaceae bacterium]|jgi:hypothetical protein|nr:DUF1572 family protein [Chitinophagaceae bacterium]
MPFLPSALKRFQEYKALGEKTFAQIGEADFYREPAPGVNSIAIIIQHLHGNMLSRWTNFLTEDGEKEWRRRDAEFEAQPRSREELLLLWEEGWKVLLDTLRGLQPEDLERTVTIRYQPLEVVDAINRQLAHYSYHVGQIVLLGKWIRARGWESLSIPRKGSAAFNEAMRQEHGK